MNTSGQQSSSAQQPLQHPPRLSFKFSAHGIVGILAIGLMIIVALIHKWHISWLYLVVAILAYSGAILFFTDQEETARQQSTTNNTPFPGLHFSYLLAGCHLAFLLLVGGFWLNIDNFFIQVGIFITAIVAGMVLPYWFNSSLHAALGVIPLGLIIIVAIITQWHIDWFYFLLAILTYSMASFVLSVNYLEANEKAMNGTQNERERFNTLRWHVGCHITLLLLAGGLWLNNGNFFVQMGIFIAAVAAGLALPFLLIRK